MDFLNRLFCYMHKSSVAILFHANLNKNLNKHFMEGLIIWANSYCRSTLAFYQQLGHSFAVPLTIYIWKSDCSLRKKTGFSDTEFGDIGIYFINDNEDFAVNALLNHKSYNHIFAVYQKSALHQKLINLSITQNITFAIASEAPCNMTPRPKRLLKYLYMSLILPRKVKMVVKYADFILNFSGYYEDELKQLGWQQEKIISCGYYPPPILGSNRVLRTIDNWQNFTILLSGIHQWHRSSWLLLKALNELKRKGIKYKCLITQDGPFLNDLKKYSEKHSLNVDFLGFVSLNELIHLYETCSVYVGTGNNEPWGMRLNDVLQCGSPLIVNRGMGGVKLVDDYGCGMAFERNDYHNLAICLETIIRDQKNYLEFAENAYKAATDITPSIKANEMAQIVSSKFKNWNASR